MGKCSDVAQQKGEIAKIARITCREAGRQIDPVAGKCRVDESRIAAQQLRRNVHSTRWAERYLARWLTR